MQGRSVTLGLAGASVALLLVVSSFDDSMSGEITTLAPRVCLGRHAAMGECFTPRPGLDVSSLRMGECVRVTYQSGKGEGPSKLLSFTEIRPEDADEGDCTP